MKTSNNKKFVNAIWVTGLYKNQALVGRTLINNNKQYVAFVTESGMRTTVPFHAIEDIRKMTILSRPKPMITSVLQKKARPTLIDKLIIEVLNSVNN